jgi:glyoxalase family protein
MPAPGFRGNPEDNTMQLTGIHHLTAISARPRDNLAFYTGRLGMRLVKKTVNQDDVSAYHLFSIFRPLPSGAAPTAFRAPDCASPARPASATGGIG